MTQRYVNQLLRIAIVTLGFLVVNSCSRNPVTGKKEFMLMSKTQELALGKQSDPGIVASFGKYQDETLQKFINDKGQQMAKISHRPDLNYEFKILDSPVVNAFAVPGGYVYFTRGILAHFNNEAEFAGVLGHEIGHITARHSAKQYSKGMLAQVGFVAGMVLSPTFRQYGQSAQQGLALLFLKFGRDAEAQSDGLGVEYSTKIGYDAHEMANFFHTLNRLTTSSDGEQIPTFLSTHPNPLDRNKRVHVLATKEQAKQNTSNLQVNRDKYLRMIDGMVYGEDPRQGYVQNNRFYHPELKFQFPIPSGWKHQNSPAQFQMASPDGKGALVFTLAKEKTLQAAKQAFITENKLTLIESNDMTIELFPATSVLADLNPQQQQGQQGGTTQQQPGIRVISYFINYDGKIYQYYGVAQQPDFPKYSGTFNNTIKQFRKLSDPQYINVKPDVISIKTVPRNGTLSSVLTSLNAPKDKHQELSILNGMELTAQVKAGMLIKTIEKQK